MNTQEDREAVQERPRTLRGYILRELAAAHRRRPASFYSLLVTPLVLLLGSHMGELRDSPHHFVLIVTLLLVFFFVVMAHAVNDLFLLWKRHYAAQCTAYRETIGDDAFIQRLGRCIRERQSLQ